MHSLFEEKYEDKTKSFKTPETRVMWAANMNL